jgi:hypothetical protein
MGFGFQPRMYKPCGSHHPKHLLDMKGSDVNGPLPHLFIFELIVNELSLAAHVLQLFSMKESKPLLDNHKDH